MLKPQASDPLPGAAQAKSPKQATRQTARSPAAEEGATRTDGARSAPVHPTTRAKREVSGDAPSIHPSARMQASRLTRSAPRIAPTARPQARTGTEGTADTAEEDGDSDVTGAAANVAATEDTAEWHDSDGEEDNDAEDGADEDGRSVRNRIKLVMTADWKFAAIAVGSPLARSRRSCSRRWRPTSPRTCALYSSMASPSTESSSRSS